MKIDMGVLTGILGALVEALKERLREELTEEKIKAVLDDVLDAPEAWIEKSGTKLDDTVFLPLIGLVREQLGIPDDVGEDGD